MTKEETIEQLELMYQMQATCDDSDLEFYISASSDFEEPQYKGIPVKKFLMPDRLVYKTQIKYHK